MKRHWHIAERSGNDTLRSLEDFGGRLSELARTADPTHR